jgi:hypothetical protein
MKNSLAVAQGTSAKEALKALRMLLRRSLPSIPPEGTTIIKS